MLYSVAEKVIQWMKSAKDRPEACISSLTPNLNFSRREARKTSRASRISREVARSRLVMLRQRALAGLSQSTRSSSPYICWGCQIRLRDTTRLVLRRSLSTFRALHDEKQNDDTSTTRDTATSTTASDGAEKADTVAVTKVLGKGKGSSKKGEKVAGRKKGRPKKSAPDKKAKQSSITCTSGEVSVELKRADYCHQNLSPRLHN